MFKSGKTEPINYSRGQRGQSLAWNWARSYQSAQTRDGDICFWESPALSASLFCPSFFLFLSLRLLCSFSVRRWAISASLHFYSLPLWTISALLYVALPLNILCLCVQPPPKLCSVDLPCVFSRILLHHPCFNIPVILLPSLSLSPALSSASCRFTHSCTISLCSDMFSSTALQPTGQDKALIYSAYV